MNNATPTPWRVLPAYDPLEDITSAGWTVELAVLPPGSGESYMHESRVVTLDEDTYNEDPLHALAHAAYHIRWDMPGNGGRFTAEQEKCAHGAAYLWLDREDELTEGNN